MDRAAAASIFAQNPQLVQMIQGKLGTLIGRPSGYIESLPPVVRRRVSGLRAIQKDHAKLESELQEEILQLEKKYFAKFTPLYEKRSSIVNGTVEPTDDEVKAGEDEDFDQLQAQTMGDEDAKKSDFPENVAGIPEFWLSAMKNHMSLAEIITDRDGAALKHLVDVRMEYLEEPGFRLIFEFSTNEFFTNKTITKTYFYQNESGYGGDFIYDHAEGDKIEWYPGKDLTVRVEAKKQRNKSKHFGHFSMHFSPLLQTRNRQELSRRPYPPNPSSTFSPLLSLLPMRTTTTRTLTSDLKLRIALSSITSLVRISRRSSSLMLLIGSPVRLSVSRSKTMVSLMMASMRTMMKTRMT